MALTVSSHICRDRRAGGSCNLAGAEEVGKVGGSMVRDYHTAHPTACAKVCVGDLWERGSCFGVEQEGAVGFLEC
jgi:hypothetical protein